MRSGWRNERIGRLCEVIAGQSPLGKFYNSDGNGLPFYQGKKDFGEKFIGEPATWTTQITKLARGGDILMSVRAPVGPVNFATTDACIGRGLAAIRVSASLNRDFLFCQLVHLRPKIAGKEGAGFASMNKAEIEALPIAYAPPTEQERIVRVLDEAFDGIATAKANAEKNLQNARSLFDGQRDLGFQNGTGGRRVSTFGDVATFRNGINFTQSSAGESVAIVGVKDFKARFWAPLDGLDTVTTDGPLPIEDLLQENDLLFVRSNGNVELIGRSLLVGSVAGRVTHSGFTIRARIHDRSVDPRYLCHFMRSRIVRRQMIDGGTGTSIKSLSQGVLTHLRVPMPSLMDQRAIVTTLEAIEDQANRLTSVYERKLAALDELKKSLLHQAFSGQF